MKNFLFIFLLFNGIIFSQKSINQKKHKKIYLKELNQKFKKYNNAFSEKDTFQKKLLKFHKNQQKIIFKNIKNNNYLIEGDYYNYLKSIVLEVIKNNLVPQKNKPVDILVYNSTEANAANIGYNFLLINVGLFNELDSEEEIKAIITHELSHAILNHHEKEIEKKVSNLFSEGYRKDISSLKINSGNNPELINLYKKYKYNFALFKKKQEYEADSLSLKLLGVNQKNIFLYQSVLEKVNKNDYSKPNKLKKATFYKILSKSSSIKLNDSLFLQVKPFNKTKEVVQPLNIDSISTHPNLEERISKLNTIYKIDSLDNKTKNSDLVFYKHNGFLQLKKQAFQCTVNKLFVEQQYLQSLHYGLLQYQYFLDFGASKETVKKNLLFFLDLKKSNQLEEYFNGLNVLKNINYNLITNFLLSISEKKMLDLILSLK